MDHYLYVQIPKSTLIVFVIIGTLTMLLCFASIWLITILYERKRLLYEEKAKRQASEYETRLQTERMQENERVFKEIAAAFHDHLGNKLAFLVTMLGDFRNLHRRNIPLAGDDLCMARNLAAEVMGDVREINRIIEGKSLLEKGLLHAVEAHVAEVRRIGGLEVNLHTNAVCLDGFEPETLLHIFRVIQESISNAVKHAQASTLTLSIASGSDAPLQVDVVDNGVGFDTTAVDRSASLGLNNMHFRAEAIDGDLQIASKPNAGTRVTLRVPAAGIP